MCMITMQFLKKCNICSNATNPPPKNKEHFSLVLAGYDTYDMIDVKNAVSAVRDGKVSDAFHGYMTTN